MLNLTLFPHSEYLLLMASGRLDALGAGTFDTRTENAHEMSRFWVLDCSNLVFLSSAGIRSLLQAVKKLRAVDGEMILLHAGDPILQVLDMSGLSGQFIICKDLTEAEEKVKKEMARLQKPGKYQLGSRQYLLKALPETKSDLILWKERSADKMPQLVSLLELGIATGKGCMAEDRRQAERMMGTFIAYPGYFFFSPDDPSLPSDYFAGKTDAPQGFYIQNAYALKGEPAYQIDMKSPQENPLHLIAGELAQVISQNQEKMPSMIHMTIITEDHHLVQACYTNEEMLMHNPSISSFWKGQKITDDYFLVAADLKCKDSSLSPDIKDQENIVSFLKMMDAGEKRINSGAIILSGNLRCWVSLPLEILDAESSRLEIVYEDEMDKPEVWELIIREIYKDAGKVILKELHGGFSAKTFQVTSFTKEGRKTIPTVLKLGKVAIVEREEKNYNDYVQKYILNNSTTIMGAHYYGEWGGVRYNFLGINGPDTQLKWLTHVYKERPADELIPLFDRVFKTVLKPWYGQPKLENIKLWDSHNPLYPFFSNLVQDAEKVLGISADAENLDCPILGRNILNPYWFLKHQWPALVNESRLWYSAVCHGDLNMQNILLDETENIYVIDFSETHPRNIVSDFARLEPIFKIEMTRNTHESDLRDKLVMEEALVNITKLTDRPAFNYQGDDPMMKKAFEMVLKMREYARMTMIFEEDIVPYWLAVLEWTLPYASYWSVPLQMQWHAAYSSGMILEKIIRKK